MRVCRPSINNYKNIFSSETAQPIGTKLVGMVPWVIPYQNSLWHPCPPSKLAAVIKTRKGVQYLKIIILAETVNPISIKLCWDGPQMVLQQNYVCHAHPPTKMTATCKLSLTQDHVANSLKNLVKLWVMIYFKYLLVCNK